MSKRSTYQSTHQHGRWPLKVPSWREGAGDVEKTFSVPTLWFIWLFKYFPLVLCVFPQTISRFVVFQLLYFCQMNITDECWISPFWTLILGWFFLWWWLLSPPVVDSFAARWPVCPSCCLRLPLSLSSNACSVMIVLNFRTRKCTNTAPHTPPTLFVQISKLLSKFTSNVSF